MTELSDAIARGEDFPGLSPAELAAAKADGHLSMCREPYFVDCDECPMLLAGIQRLVRLVRPAIEDEVRDQERDHYEEELRGQRDVAYNEGVLASREQVDYLTTQLARAVDELMAHGWDRAAAEFEVGDTPSGRHAAHEEVEGD